MDGDIIKSQYITDNIAKIYWATIICQVAF